MFQFDPRKEIRDFDGRNYMGKTATVECSDTQDSRQQYRIVGIDNLFAVGSEHWQNPDLLKFHSGWVEGVELLKKGTKIRKKIRLVKLVVHQNGGRSDRTALSYREFFDDEYKEELQDYWQKGFAGRMMNGRKGDPDQADIVVGFDGFSIDGVCYNIPAPEEWKSELYKGRIERKLKRGFYKDAEAAIRYFSNHQNDDLFGTRYFPVLAISRRSKNVNQIRKIAYIYAKAHSTPIQTTDYIIVGTRCKPDKYENMIKATYEIGGKVVRSTEWTWE